MSAPPEEIWIGIPPFAENRPWVAPDGDGERYVRADIVAALREQNMVMRDDERRVRPNADLAGLKITLDWKTITISGDDEATLGRVFMWLLRQIDQAREA